MASKIHTDVVRRLQNQLLVNLVMVVNDLIRRLDEVGSETLLILELSLFSTLVCPGDNLIIIGGVIHLGDDSSCSGGEQLHGWVADRLTQHLHSKEGIRIPLDLRIDSPCRYHLIN